MRVHGFRCAQRLAGRSLGKNSSRRLGGKLALLAAIAGCSNVLGASITWTNTGTDFNTGTDWSTGTVPGSADNAIFTGLEITNPNLSAAATIQGLTFSSANSYGYNLSGLALTLTNVGTGGSAAYNAGNTSGINIISAPLILGGANGATETFSQALGGTLSISGGVTTTSASVLESMSFTGGGTFNINGPITLASSATNATAGNILVGTAASGSKAVLNISANISAVGMDIGNGTGANSGGAVYQTAGVVTLFDNASGAGALGADRIFTLGGTGSTGSPGYGYYFTSGGSITALQMNIGGRTTGTAGVMDVAGGTVNVTGELNLARGNAAGTAGYGTLNIESGAVNFDTNGVNVVTPANVLMQTGYIAGSVAQINVGGGPGNAALTGGNIAASGIDLGQGAVAATDVLNILSNGTVTVPRIFQSSSTPTGLVNFNGGTLKATATNAGSTFLNATNNVKAVTIYGGGGTIDNSGTNITIATPLVAASGNGLTGISVATGGAGYIGAPAVSITGGGGVGATGYATVNSAGSVTGIVITNPGTGYTTAPTVSLIGGGYSTAATVSTPTFAADSIIGGMTFTGSGTTTLTGTSTYTGATTINAGSILNLTGALGNTTATINSGGFLTGSGTVVGNVVINHGGLIDFTRDGLSTTTALTAGGLTLGSTGNAAGITYNINGTNADLIKLGSGVLNDLGGAQINLNASNIPSGSTTYTLLSYGSQTGLSTASGGGFTIGTHPAGLYSFTFNDTSTSLTLTVAATPTPLTAYWTGRDDSVWSDFSASGPITNFSSDTNGTTDAGQIPGATTDVVFTAGTNGNGTSLNGAAITTTLGANFTINSLTFDSTPGSVAISGSNTLTLNAAASTGSLGYAAGTGLIVQNGAGPVNIGVTTVIPATSQSWSNNGSNPLTISSAVTGTATAGNTTTLTFNGSGSGSAILSGAIGNGTGGGTLALNVAQTGGGPVILSGSNTFTGGVTVTSGTLRLGSSGALNSTAPNAVNLSGGTIDLNSNSVTVSNLTGGSAGSAGGLITDSNTSAGNTVLTDIASGVQTFYGTISDGGTRTIAFNASGSGTVVLANNNAYSGGTQLTNGSLQALSSNSLGSGTINMSSGAVSLKIGNGVTLANKIIVTAAAPGAGNGALSTVTTTDTATFSGEIDYNASLTSGGSIVGPTAGGLLSFTGPIIEPFTNAQPFVQVRAGIVQLADVTGNSSYPELLVATPTASLGHDNGMASNATLVLNGGTMDLNGYNQTVAGLGLFTNTATGVITNTNGDAAGGDTGPGTGPLGTSILTVNTSSTAFPDSAPSTYGGNINSYVSLIKTGAGTLALTGSNSSYFGGTVIQQGVLAVSSLDNGNTSSPNGLGESLLGAQDLIFASPGGTLRYTGATTSTGRNFTINDGVTATMDVSNAAASLTVNGSATVDGSESASPASFTKGPGAGTLILAGTYPYHGNTTVSGGVLLVNGTVGTPGNGNIVLASGATLGGTGTVSGSFNHTAGTIVGGASPTGPTSGALTLTDALTLNGGTDLNNINASSLVSGTINQQGYINATGGVTIGTTPEVINLQIFNTLGSATYVYNLIDYSGTLNGTPNFIYTSNLGRATFVTDLSTPGEINVDISTSGPANIYWNSTSSSVWDAGSPSNASTGTANWLNSGNGTISKFAQGDNVTFADSGTVVGGVALGSPLQTNITINTAVNPGSVNVTSNSSNYTFTGTGGIGGTGALTLSGSSTLTLATSNSYSGGTNINGGILNLGNSAAIGTLGTISFGGGVLQYSASNNADYSSRFSTAGGQPIAIDTNGRSVTFASNLTSSGGSLTKLGAGTLTLTGTGNSYNGNTVITGGTLSVSSQGNLGGNGPIVFNGGSLGSPGATLTNPLVVNPAGGSLSNTGNLFLSGAITGSGTLVSSPTTPDIFTGAGFTPGNNSSSASFTGTLVSQYQVNLTDQSASPYANYNASIASPYSFTFGLANYAPLAPVQLGSLSGVAGTTLRSGVTAGIGPVVYQIGALGTNTTFAGNINDGSAANTVAINKVGSGNLTLSGSGSYTGGTNVSGGTLTIGSATAYPANTPLNILSGAQVTIANHGVGPIAVPIVSTLSNSGTIDIANNALVLVNNSYGSVNSQIQAAFKNGTWTGTSATNGVLTSSAAQSDTTHLTAVGVATNLTSFETLTVPATDILVKYTYFGDANLDGKVDGSDYSLIDSGYLTGATGWQNGDFNYDNVINGSDYTLIDNAFNRQGAQISAELAQPTALLAGAASSVPEPASLAFIGITTIGLLGRRNRRMC